MPHPNWTPVEESLPVFGGVLVSMRERRVGCSVWSVDVATFYCGAFYRDLAGRVPLDHVTHWMALPDFPESYDLPPDEAPTPPTVTSGTAPSLPSPP